MAICSFRSHFVNLRLLHQLLGRVVCNVAVVSFDCVVLNISRDSLAILSFLRLACGWFAVSGSQLSIVLFCWIYLQEEVLHQLLCICNLTQVASLGINNLKETSEGFAYDLIDSYSTFIMCYGVTCDSS